MAGRVFWRSFFLETLWNYEKMQNVGFLFCIYPALERLYPEDPERGQVVERHLGLVNTHPAMGSLLAGLTARLETDLDALQVVSYRKRIMAALAAYGDRLFWSNLRPLAAVVSVLFCLSFFGSFAGSLALLTVYNAPQMFFRVRGFGRGWGEGVAVLQRLTSPALELTIRVIRLMMALGAGLAAGFLATASLPADGGAESVLARPLIAVLLAALAGLAYFLIKKRVSLSLLVYSTIAGMALVLVLLSK